MSFRSAYNDIFGWWMEQQKVEISINQKLDRILLGLAALAKELADEQDQNSRKREE